MTRIIYSLIIISAFVISPVAYANKSEGSSAPSPSSRNIYQAAKSSVGKEMWRGYGLANGKLGCAAALCNVLKKAGISSVSSSLVTAMRRQMLSSHSGCSERIVRNGEGQEISDAVLLKDCMPGDILLAFKEPPNKTNAGTSAHCGIMGQATQVYTNNWMDGIWTEVEIHQMFDYYPYIRLLRLGSKQPRQPGRFAARLTAGQ